MKRALVLLLILAFLLPWGSLVQVGRAQDTAWTIMVYMAADNNLEDMSYDDFAEMAEVGSTQDIKIVVQYDRMSGGFETNPDWTSTKRFLVQQGDEPLPSNQIEDIGEVAMDDPNTLIDFVDWAMSGFPADHYFLVLWDHGLSWQGLVKDESNSSNYLTTPELGSALQQIVANNGGRRIDLVGFDTCRTTLEIMYEIRDYVDFIIGSEKDEDARGWAYNDFLGPLVADPSMTPLELSKVVVDTFIEEYEGVSAYSAILSSIDARRIGGLVSSLDDLISDMYRFIPYFGKEIRAARNSTEKYEVDERDLYDMADELIKHVDNVRIERKAEIVKSNVLLTVSYERHWDNEQDLKGVRLIDAHGISLSYPTIQVLTSYNDLAFSADTLWNEYLDYYQTSGKNASVLNVLGSNMDANGDDLNDTMSVTLTSGVDGFVEYDVYRAGEFVKEANMDLMAGTPQTVTYSPFVPGFYNYYFHLFNTTGFLVNYTMIMSSEMSRNPVLKEKALCVEQLITLHGMVMDEKGRNLADAVIVARNHATGETLEATTNGSGYSFLLVFPRWMQPGDVVDINASYEGRIGGIRFVVPTAPSDMSYDLVVDLGEATMGLLDLLVIALMVAIAAILSAIFTSRLIRSKVPVSEPEREDAPSQSNLCGVCGAGVNLGTFSISCRNCGSVYHSSCAKGKKRCPSCRNSLA